MVLIKNDQEIGRIKKAGNILAHVLEMLRKEIKPGVKPTDLDQYARELIEKNNARPTFLNYKPHGASKPYPATICASVNEVVVHGVPTNIKLEEEDIFSVDCGVNYEGYNADAAFSVGVGKISQEHEKLLKITKESLELGIKAAQPGNTLGDIGYAIGSHIEKHNYSVIKGLTGHGIGKELHEDPSVFNRGNPGEGMELKVGMALALEPMVSLGSGEVVQDSNDGYITKDGSTTAHFEHTIIITKKGPFIATKL